MACRLQLRGRSQIENPTGCSTDHRKVVCSVLQELPDLIIVSYESPQKTTFQGALLKVSDS